MKELISSCFHYLTIAKNDIDGLVERKLVDEISLNKVKKGYVKGELFDKTVKSIT